MSEFTHRLPHSGWSKPSRNEQDYFHREEFRARMDAARHREAQRALEERAKWLDDHRDRCPKCGGTLEVVDTADARVDQCANCLGVWLDHETFDTLTHPQGKNEYLTGILREVLLQYTTGRVNPMGGQDQ